MLPRGEAALIAVQIGLTATAISPSIFSALINLKNIEKK